MHFNDFLLEPIKKISLKPFVAKREKWFSGKYPVQPPGIDFNKIFKEKINGSVAKVKAEQELLGRQVRELFESRCLPSVAAEGFKAPGVVVSYTTDPDMQSGKKFLSKGLQTAAGVPLQCDERADFMTFRVGLFGLEKWHHVERTVGQLAAALDGIGVAANVEEAVAG